MLATLRGTDAARRGRILLALAGLIVALWALAPSAAHAAGCTDSWKAASSGSWYTGANWSKEAAPAAGEEACITANGTYTVNMTAGAAVSLKSLTIGGSSGVATLEVEGQCGNNASLTTTAGLSTDADGALIMSEASCGNSATIVGPITNGGSFTIAAGNNEGSRHVDGPFTNNGTLTVNYNGSFEASKASFTNDGAVKIAEGKKLVLEDESSFANTTGGSIVATGSGFLAVEPGTTFNEGAGTTSGTQPVLVRNSAVAYSGAGASTIAVQGTSSTISGNISSGQNLRLQGICGENALLKAASSWSNAGAITVTEASCGGYADLETTGTLTSSGSITSATGDKEGSRYLVGSITNKGTLTTEYPTTFEGTSAHGGKEATLTNEGTLKLEATTLKIVGSNTVTNAGGEIAGAASGLLQGESGTTFNEGAGKTTGTQPVLLKNSALNYTGSGEGPIAVQGTSSSLSGNISAGQSLRLQGVCGENTLLTAAASWSNAGAITVLTSSCGGYADLNTSAGTLTNTGTLTTQTGDKEGSRYLFGDITNKGTLTVEYPTTYGGPSEAKTGLLTNEGTFAIDGVTLVVQGGGNTVSNAGGEIAAGATGLLEEESGSTFDQGAGKITGTLPVLLRNSALAYVGTGAGLVTVQGTGGTLSGNLASGQILHLQSVCGENTLEKASASWTNAGTITLAATSCGGYADLETSAGTLTNSGSLTTLGGDKEGSRYLVGNLTNTGTLAIEYATAFEGTAATLKNEGTLKLVGVELHIVGAQALANASGEIIASGSGFLFQEAGSFNEGAGKISGGTRPVILQNTALTYSGSGASTIEQRGTGSTLSGEVHKGQVLVAASVCGQNTSIASSSFKNAGTIYLTSESCGGYSLFDLGTGTLTNVGVLLVEAGTGGTREIEGDLVNEKTLDLVETQLHLTGSFTQTKKGTFVPYISASGFGSVAAAGAVTLTGKSKLKQAKGYTPTKGQSFEILKASALTGEFTKVSANKVKKTKLLYLPHYSAKGATLVVEE